MMKKTGGDKVIMEKGKRRDRYMMDMGTSMDVKASPSYNSWYGKVESHDGKKLQSGKNKLEEQYYGK